MQIQDIAAIYKFIGSMSCAGISAFILSLGIVIYIILDKKNQNDPILKITSRSKLALIGFAMSISIILFKAESNQQNQNLKLANQLKSGMTFYKLKDIAIEDILYTYSIIDTTVFDSADIVSMISKFPSEFSSYYISDTIQTFGIRIIDPITIAQIDKYHNDNLPYIKNSILSYMSQHNRDTMSFKEINSLINEFFDTEWIETMISTYDTTFTPLLLNTTTSNYDEMYGLTCNVGWRTQK